MNPDRPNSAPRSWAGKLLLAGLLLYLVLYFGGAVEDLFGLGWF